MGGGKKRKEKKEKKEKKRGNSQIDLPVNLVFSAEHAPSGAEGGI